MRCFIALVSAAALLSACDSGGSGGGGVVTPTPTPSPANTAPTITSATTASFAENATGVAYQTVATDAQGDAITYTLSGTDAAKFTLSATGALSYVAAPDFETPGDANADNVYEVTIRAADAGGNSQIALRLTVTNVADLGLKKIADYQVPVQILPVPGTSRIFVAQRDGKIYVTDPASGSSPGSLYLSSAMETVPYSYFMVGGSGGLTSIATAPDYATSGILYVAGTSPAGTWEIRRYRRLASGDGDGASEDVILRIPAPGEALGGWIGFGPDGFLYVAIGTDGPLGTNRASLMGKLLRIDVGSDAYPADPNKDYAIPASNPFVGVAGALPEIYASNVGHPWRASFDGPNLLVGVYAGQPQYVFMVRPQDAGKTFDRGEYKLVDPLLPAIAYSIGRNELAGVVGGLVYRGPISDLVGKYIFGDSVFKRIWSIPPTSLVPGANLDADRFTSLDSMLIPPELEGTQRNITSFGEDSSGNLYMAFQNSVYVAEWR